MNPRPGVRQKSLCISISRTYACPKTHKSFLLTPVCISGPEEAMIVRAKALTEDLLEVVRSEYTKARQLMFHQQSELQQAQAQYAAYSTYQVRYIFGIYLLNSAHDLS